MTEVNEKLRREREKKNDKGAAKGATKKIVPLKATLSQISNQYNYTLRFNKDMNFTVVKQIVKTLFVLEVEHDDIVYART